MTRIILKPHELTAEGHAGYGPHGQDIVCAAISVLAQTLAACVEDQAEEAEIMPGYVHIRWVDETEAAKVIKRGFELLCEAYPNHVSFEEQE